MQTDVLSVFMGNRTVLHEIGCTVSIINEFRVRGVTDKLVNFVTSDAKFNCFVLVVRLVGVAFQIQTLQNRPLSHFCCNLK